MIISINDKASFRKPVQPEAVSRSRVANSSDKQPVLVRGGKQTGLLFSVG